MSQTPQEIINEYSVGPGSDYRMPVFKRFHELLCNDFEVEDIKRIEISCFNKAIADATSKNILKKWNNSDFMNLYSSTTYRLLTHFSTLNAAADLANRIFDGDICIDSIAQLSSEELIPGKYDELKESLENRKKQCVVQKTSTIYVCPKCKERKTTTQEIQLRSLDEPANIKATCLSCGHKWIAY